MYGDLAVVEARINVAATTNDSVELVCPFEGNWRLARLSVMPNATLAADGTNYSTLTAYGTDGGTTTTIATALNSSATAFTAGTERAFTLTGSAIKQMEFTQGKSIRVKKTHSGTGGAVDVMIVAVLERYRP